MKKSLRVIILIGIIVLSFTQISLAADEAKLKIITDKNVLEIGDSVELTISVLNTSITDGITKVCGAIEFNDSIFELETLNYEDAKEEANSIIKEILVQFEEEGYDLLYVSDKWCIASMEQDGVIALAAVTLSDTIKESSSYSEIGNITLNVKDSATSGTTKISLTNMQAEETEISDVSTSSITVNADISDIESLDGDEEEEEIEDETEDETDEAEEEAPYTGVEDIIPFILIVAVIGVIGYIKYKKYQGI